MPDNSPYKELSDEGYTFTGCSFQSKSHAAKEARKFRRIGYYARVMKGISNHVYAMYGNYFLMIKRKPV